MPGKKIPQDPKAREGSNANLMIPNKPIPDVSPRPEPKDPININLCEPDYRAGRVEISCQAQLLDHVRLNVNGTGAEDFNSARQTTQEMRAYRRGE